MASSQRQYNTLPSSGSIAAPSLSENGSNVYEDDIRRPLLGSSSSTDLDGNGKKGSQSWLRAVYGEGKEIWLQGKGMILVTLAQFFGASMNVMTQILELDSGLHPFQVGSISATSAGCSATHC